VIFESGDHPEARPVATFTKRAWKAYVPAPFVGTNVEVEAAVDVRVDHELHFELPGLRYRTWISNRYPLIAKLAPASVKEVDGWPVAGVTVIGTATVPLNAVPSFFPVDR
jgi:hypothetical protein